MTGLGLGGNGLQLETIGPFCFKFIDLCLGKLAENSYYG